jgi:tRNA pseudouridine38-40 synthase
MARFKVFLEYEGTRYSGWQIQTNARTVQGEISAAVRQVFDNQPFQFQGAGRTDAGVHALCQVAHLDVTTVLAPEIIRMKLNDLLPADINILEVEKTHPRFHARHDAVSRSYLYHIARRRTAFGKRYVWWIKEDLNVGAMRRAAALFVGMRDFQSFTDDDPEEKSTTVLVEGVSIHEHGALLLLQFHGSHFLWKMVRRVVGVIAAVGRGTLGPDEVKRFLNEKVDHPAHLTAPPSGLFLERVYYRGDTIHQNPTPVLNIAHG